MENTIAYLKSLLHQKLPGSKLNIDGPDADGGNYWIDVSLGKKRQTLEYRPRMGFGLFHKDVGFGEGPAEIYRTPERVAQRLEQLMRSGSGRKAPLGLRELRELYGQSQVKLAKRAGVKQPAISRFEKRGEVKLSTLASTIKALGGRLEVRAHFSDADVPLSLSGSKR